MHGGCPRNDWSAAYAHDAMGRLTSKTVVIDGKTFTEVAYNIDMNVTGWKWSDGKARTIAYDSAGRMVSYTLGDPAGSGPAAGVTRTLALDSGGRIGAYTHTGAGSMQGALDQVFAYDNLDRLTAATAGGTSTSYSYDATGNRTARTVGATTYTNTIASDSNRLNQTQDVTGTATIVHDAAGHITSDGTNTYTYGDRGRMSSATTAVGVVSFKYNGLEQRVYKTSPAGTSYYVYDEQGQLLGEYDANGVPVYETIYLGSTPVGVMKQTGTAGGNNIAVALHNVYADQIDTPRVITKQDHTIVWRWDTAEAFGATAPDQDPSGLGVFVFNQRFPGQVADAETGLNQNWNREYSARGGRYESSDPIGLRGGMNTFLYGDANPLSRADSTGLASAGGALGGVVGGWIGTALGEAVGGPAGALAGRAAGARLGSALGSAIEDDCQCVGGYVRLYRVVGEAEYRSISSTQQYSILPTGFSQKQFWFRMGDAKWFAEVEVKMDPTAGSKPRYIISSKICNSTLRQGASFSDVGHQAISFDNSGLPYVNRDASVTGGIRNVAGIPVVK